MNTEFSFANGTLSLFRYPAKSQHPTLQAWGSEDEYILNHVHSTDIELGKTLILNDEFGALACGLCANLSEGSVWQSDSYIAHCAVKENLLRNELTPNFAMLDSLQTLAGTFDTVIIRLPKNLQFLEYQLQQLLHCITAQTQVIATGKIKAVTKPVLNLFEKHLGQTKTSLAVKKSRLIFCTPDENKLRDTPNLVKSINWQLDTKIQNQAIELINLANVFSSRSLDIGARFMLDNLMPFNDEKVLDLGCGNGVLGIATLAQTQNCDVTFVDESFMAVESARLGVQANVGDKIDNAHFITDNCLDKHTKGEIKTRYDRVLCNPPFHQQNTLTDHIAWQMFNDAKACLHKSGKLWVVGNRHLGYHDKLKRLFGGVKTLASNPKFVILEAVKR